MNLYRAFSSFVNNQRKALAVLVILGFIIYFNSLFGEFIWDDESQIVYNYLVHSVSNIPNFFIGSTFINLLSGQAQQSGMHYRPLMSTIFSFLYFIFGAKPFFFHLLQIAFHLINSALVFLLFKRFLSKNLAYLLSVVFLVHPMNVEAVAYISALHDVMFFTFGMAALLVLVKDFKTERPRTKLILVLLLFSLFSKITGILFFIVIGVYLLFFKKRYFSRFLRFSLLPVVFYTFLRVVVAGVRAERLPDIPIMRTAFVARLLNVPAMTWFYIKTFFFPKDLLVAQYWLVSSKNFPGFYLPLLLVLLSFCLFLGSGIYVFRRNKKHFPVFLMFFVWLIIGLGFHLQLVPLDFTVAERWFYFPMAGLIFGSFSKTSKAAPDK